MSKQQVKSPPEGDISYLDGVKLVTTNTIWWYINKCQWFPVWVCKVSALFEPLNDFYFTATLTQHLWRTVVVISACTEVRMSFIVAPNPLLQMFHSSGVLHYIHWFRFVTRPRSGRPPCADALQILATRILLQFLRPRYEWNIVWGKQIRRKEKRYTIFILCIEAD